MLTPPLPLLLLRKALLEFCFGSLFRPVLYLDLLLRKYRLKVAQTKRNILHSGSRHPPLSPYPILQVAIVEDKVYLLIS